MADPNVLRTVLAVGRRKGATPKQLLAAIETGLVESGLRNLNYGDADSKGWRQERTSLYPNPTNVAASAARFFNETKQFDRQGISAGELAARVQRPAAQYRGRYQQVRSEALKILRGQGITPGGASSSSGGGGSQTLTVGGTRGLPGVNATLPGKTFSAVVPTVDQAAYDHARKLAIVGQMIARHNPNSFLLRSGLLSPIEPSLSQFTGSQKVSTSVGGQKVRAPGVAGTPGQSVTVRGRALQNVSGVNPGSVKTFDRKPVVSWMIPALEYARQHGWKGTVTSGVRSKAEQMAAATRFGLQHYGPAGPLGSNHVAGHSGAVDVSDPDGLERALRSYRGRKPIRAMKDDPVHFSLTGH